MIILRTVDEVRDFVARERGRNASVGLVPTMGALHEGHLSLVEKAVEGNDVAIVSVFVNPTQFNNPNDLATYPRQEEADFKLLAQAGVAAVFAPSVEEMYPGGPAAQPEHKFELGEAAEVMEGKYRPGHFQGVAQVVSLLFRIVEPDRAYFGEKDFQQIAVIRRMVEIEGGFDGLEIVSCPIKRHPDGLAMSSRNVRLTPAQRMVAPCISLSLHASLVRAAEMTLAETKKWVIDTINRFPFMEVEYFEIVDGLTMQPITDWNESDYPVGCITAYCGEVRLIDNIKYNRTKYDAPDPQV